MLQTTIFIMQSEISNWLQFVSNLPSTSQGKGDDTGQTRTRIPITQQQHFI